VLPTFLTPTVNFTSSATSGVSGQRVTLTLTVTSDQGTPTGFVLFKNGNGILGQVTVTNGVAVLVLNNIAAGNYSFSAIYSGDSNFFFKFTDPIAVAIAQNKLPIGRLDSAANNMLVGWAADQNSPNVPLVVQFMLDGKVYATRTASLTRTDLQKTLGSTNHGFVFQVPPLVAGVHAVKLVTFDPISNASVVIGQTTLVSNSLYFDEAWYLKTYPDVARLVAAHVYASGWQQFMLVGAHQGRNPSPFFDELWYRQHNPDINAAIKAGKIASGFAHFVARGSKEGRDPSPYFNEMFYRREYPDIANAVTSGALFSGFTHFLKTGRVEGRNPTPWFDSADYRARYADVNSAINNGTLRSAFDHFVTMGVKEVRQPGPYYVEADYLALNSDIQAAVSSHTLASGLVHFIRQGFFDGRPSWSGFDETFYLNTYPAATTAINAGQAKSAFQYFLLFGRLLGDMPHA
jgi:hypothetical protein